MMGPLTRRRLLSSLDEDDAQAWPPSQLAKLVAAARQAEIARDRPNVEQGRRLVAGYIDSENTTDPDALRAYMRDLMAAPAAGGSWQPQPRRLV